MRKQIFGILTIIVIVFISTINIHFNFNENGSLDKIAFENIEALARGEGGGGGESGKATCYTRASVNENDEYLRCVECKYVKGTGVTTGGYCKW